MTKRCPKGSGVRVISAVSKKRRRRKSGAAELSCERAWCMLDRSQLKTLSKRTNHPEQKRCEHPTKHTDTKHFGYTTINTVNYNRHFGVLPQSTMIYDLIILDSHDPMILRGTCVLGTCV